MPTLSYLSCLLTIASTVLVGRRLWQGWVVAAVNSVIIGAIGWQTGQWGFVPANLFCLAIYAYNLKTWRAPQQNEMGSAAGSRQSPTA
jgi:nicotinamide riboside transporter PnuC